MNTTQSDRRRRLESIRDQLTAAMESAEPSVMAQIAGQLRQVLKEIDELPDAAGESTRARHLRSIAASDAASRPA